LPNESWHEPCRISARKGSPPAIASLNRSGAKRLAWQLATPFRRGDLGSRGWSLLDPAGVPSAWEPFCRPAIFAFDRRSRSSLTLLARRVAIRHARHPATSAEVEIADFRSPARAVGLASPMQPEIPRRRTMKAILIAACLSMGIATPAFGASAAATASLPVESATHAPGPTHYDFEDDQVEGDIQRPDGDLISSVKKAKQPSLIEIRKNFIPEILKMIEDL
jgi:hypothetical protein